MTGYFDGTADFDPGASTVNFTSAGGYDAYVVKLDAAGRYVWAKQQGGTGLDRGLTVAVDAEGSVYTTGEFAGTVDFDPSASTSNLTSAGDSDAFVSKLDRNGTFVWARRMGGAGTDIGFGLALGSDGSVYTTGTFEGSADFDPGTGSFTLTAAGEQDAFVSRLDSAGGFVGAWALGGTTADYGYFIAVTAAGDPYVTGYFTGTADFNPDPDTYPMTSAGGWDMFLAKIAQPSVGDLVWNDANSNGVQDSGETGIAGAAVEVFASTDATIGNADDVSRGVAITDAYGKYRLGGLIAGVNYYLVFRPPVGYTFTTANFGADTLDSDPDAAGVTAMFTLSAWEQRLDLDAGLVGGPPAFGFALGFGGSSDDASRSVALDSGGNAYVTGTFNGTVDFDYGPGTYSLTSAGGDDAFVAKYSAGGALVWARKLGARAPTAAMVWCLPLTAACGPSGRSRAP